MRRAWCRRGGQNDVAELAAFLGQALTDSLFRCAYRVIGVATGNERLREEGQLDKAKGDLYKTAGDVKDAVRKATG